MAGINYMTKEGYEKLVEQLDNLKINERQRIAKAIAEAREKGDLSENAEYHAAKDEQGMLEMKINELDKQLANARILDESTVDTSKVSILTQVTIKNTKNNFKVTYKLVSESEANIKEKKISVDSPMGKGLLGKKVGEIAEIQTPGGTMQFEVLEIGI
ncbi:MAG TPA: transcription elongation factor GreA [Bacteroidetes bacterium]|nr:transcription elongation factor GreA [Bacteroidota bacterium]